MTGKSQGINVKFLHINRQNPGCLSSIYNEKKVMLPANFPKFCQGHAGSANIGRMKGDDGSGVGADQRFHLFRDHRAVFSARNTIESNSMGGQLHYRTHHRIVFHGGNQNVITRF